MNDLTYKTEVGTIRPSILADCYVIGRDMRAEDAFEMWSVFKLSPVESSLKSFRESPLSMTILNNNIPVSMFGLMPVNLAGDNACLWMLSTDGINNIGRVFVRNSREWIKRMNKIYPLLYGYVYTGNLVSMRWISFLGAKWGSVVSLGIDKIPFRYFYFDKE